MIAMEQANYPSRRRGIYALIILMIVTFTALLDRYLIGLLLEPMRADLHITDTQASLLQGLAFAFFYSILGLPFGRLVDRSNRRNIIFVGVLLWSMMTILCGLAESYPALFIARLGVGLGEACLAPAAYSLITDLFPPNRHGRALALFTVSSVVGGGGSFIIGAQALELATHLHQNWTIVTNMIPWRLTFVLVGLPGIPVAFLLLSISEPARHGQHGQVNQPTFRELGTFLRTIRKPLLLVIAAGSAGAIAGTGVIGWLAVFLSRTYGTPVTESGHWIGLLLIISALLGGPFAGWLNDSRFVSNMKGEKLMMVGFGCAIAMPFALIFPLAPTMLSSLALFLCYTIMYNVQACSYPAVLQDILPNRFKGQVSALYWLCVGLIGFGGGSTAVALLTDRLFANEAMLRYSLAIVGTSSMAVCILCVLLGRNSYQKARDVIRQVSAL